MDDILSKIANNILYQFRQRKMVFIYSTVPGVNYVEVLYLLLGVGLDLVQPVPKLNSPAHPAERESR